MHSKQCYGAEWPLRWPAPLLPASESPRCVRARPAVLGYMPPPLADDSAVAHESCCIPCGFQPKLGRCAAQSAAALPHHNQGTPPRPACTSASRFRNHGVPETLAELFDREPQIFGWWTESPASASVPSRIRATRPVPEHIPSLRDAVGAPADGAGHSDSGYLLPR